MRNSQREIHFGSIQDSRTRDPAPQCVSSSLFSSVWTLGSICSVLVSLIVMQRAGEEELKRGIYEVRPHSLRLKGFITSSSLSTHCSRRDVKGHVCKVGEQHYYIVPLIQAF